MPWKVSLPGIESGNTEEISTAYTNKANRNWVIEYVKLANRVMIDLLLFQTRQDSDEH